MSRRARPDRTARAPALGVLAVSGWTALMVEALVLEHGRDEVLRRLANPFWFQLKKN